MDRYVPLVRIVFSKMHDRFKDIRTYFFHNCIYQKLYTDPTRTQGIPTERLLQDSRNTRLFVIGDAAMAPEELMLPGGSISWRNHNPEPGIEWLRKLRGHFPYSVWLNPIHRDDWDWAWGSFTIRHVSEVFHMEEMTLEGMKNAVEYLSQQKAYKPY
jgi:uncharacterized protein with von Willebrand factor type A (vWA) domain